MPRASPQLICFSYHKCGTTLLLNVMRRVSKRLDLVFANYYGLVEQLDLAPDVILLPHSLLRAPLDRPYRAIRLIRDPRDIWVSGYLYHLRCDEEWCRNADMDPTPPIRWPKVDYSFAHWPEDWKRGYLERLGGKSYQQNLIDRPLADGLDFELDGYTGCTLAAMRAWTLNGAAARDVKLEDVVADFDSAMLGIFDHFGFTAEQQEAALEVARAEDIRRMDDAAIAERPQIHSRTISKWRDVLSPAQIVRFEASHGDLIRELGYAPAEAIVHCLEDQDAAGSPHAGTPLGTEGAEADATVPQPAQPPEEPSATPNGPATTPDARIRLSAGGRSIRPTATGPGTYTFVVPAGPGRVWLESRCGLAPPSLASNRRDPRRLGVNVRRVLIRSGADEIVIMPDDPRLTSGWYDTERAGTEFWRWTDGSAELPWAGVAGAALVTVHCGTLAEYPADDAGPSADRPDGHASGVAPVSCATASHAGGTV